MKIFALSIAAAAFLAPAMISSASAETDINVRIGTPGYNARAQGVVVTSPARCRTVVTKVKRANGTKVTTKKRVCR